MDLRVRRGTVTEVGPGLRPAPSETVHDADGRWAMPGAVGRPRPPHPVGPGVGPARPRRDDRAGRRRSAGSPTTSPACRATVRSSRGGATGPRPGRAGRPWPSWTRSAPVTRSSSSAGTPTTGGSTAWPSARSGSRRGTPSWTRTTGSPSSPASRTCRVRRGGRGRRRRGRCGARRRAGSSASSTWSSPRLPGLARPVRAGVTSLRVRAATYADPSTTSSPPGSDRGTRSGPATGLLRWARSRSSPTAPSTPGRRSCCEPYADAAELEHPRGTRTPASRSWWRSSGEATAARIEVAVHAIGDRAVRTALDAFERTGAAGTVEHAQLVAVRPTSTRMARARGPGQRPAGPPVGRPRRHRPVLAGPGRTAPTRSARCSTPA